MIISCSISTAATSAGRELESLIDIGPSSTGQVASEDVGVPATSSEDNPTYLEAALVMLKQLR